MEFILAFIAFVYVGETFFPDPYTKVIVCNDVCHYEWIKLEKDESGMLTNETIELLGGK